MLCCGRTSRSKGLNELEYRFNILTHVQVVEPLFNLIKARKVSYENLLLINFDSHSDLSIPKNLKTHQDGFLRSHDVLK